MATFIMLMNLTDEGSKGIKEAPNRRAKIEKILDDLNGKILSSYLTMGSYDRVLAVDFPDDQSALKFAISIGSLGIGHSNTLRAFSDEEALKLIADAP